MKIIIVHEEVVWREYSVEVEDEIRNPEEIVREATRLFLDGQFEEEGIRDIMEERIVSVETEDGSVIDTPESSIIDAREEERNLINKLEAFFKLKCTELGFQSPTKEEFLNFLKKEVLERLREEV